jgi:DNA-binding transcriptional LysR family regulator
LTEGKLSELNWDDIRLFLLIAEQGSFRRAAEKVEPGHATLSRRVESLEKALTVKLFNRSSTGLRLTSAGEEMLAAATSMRAELDSVKVKIQGIDQSISGKITFTLSEVFSNYLVLPALEQFQRQYPDIIVEIIPSFQVLDLNIQQADIAIRSTDSPDDQYIGRNLGCLYEAAYASEDYLKEFLHQEENNRQHNWIRPGEKSVFRGALIPKYQCDSEIKSDVIVDSIEAQLILAKQGRGIATLPCLIGEKFEELVRICPAYPITDIWLLSHRQLRGNRRMQLFREFLTKLFSSNHALIIGETPRDSSKKYPG